MKKLLFLILPFLLILAIASCSKESDTKVSFEDITYEFTSNVSEKYNVVYTQSGGAQNNISFTGKTWTKTIPGGKAPQQYVIMVAINTSGSFISNLKIFKGKKVVETQDFDGTVTRYLQYNTQ